MGDKCNIHWTDATWNPMHGCTKISPGCANCYAEKMAKRLRAMGQPRYANGFQVTCHGDDSKLMTQPERWKKPRRIFVSSMGDLFHPEVPDSFINDVYGSMLRAPQHTYQILTKRHRRMAHFLANEIDWPGVLMTRNIWHGVSITCQKEVKKLVPLSRMSVRNKFISFEPLLESLDLSPYSEEIARIDSAIIGGESGPGARPMYPEWTRNIFRALGMPGRDTPGKVFVKQMGTAWACANESRSRKGDIPQEWPIWARRRDDIWTCATK